MDEATRVSQIMIVKRISIFYENFSTKEERLNGFKIAINLI